MSSSDESGSNEGGSDSRTGTSTSLRAISAYFQKKISASGNYMIL